MKGLPVTAWRDSRLQLASEKQGGLSSCISWNLQEVWEKNLGSSFLWESRCEDCVCYSMTLECNTQRARSLGASALTGWVQFDSDYSDGDEASPIFSQGQDSISLSRRGASMDTANSDV